MSDTLTRLEAFLIANDIGPAELARKSGVSRAHIWRLRAGRMEPTRAMMVRLAEGCSRILDRTVSVSDIFDIGERS